MSRLDGMNARTLKLVGALVGLAALAACTTPRVSTTTVVGPSDASSTAVSPTASSPGQPPLRVPPNPMIGGVAMYPSRSIADNLAQSPDHHTLAAALAVAGLADTLKEAGPYTIFAPTDSAFRSLPAGLLEQLMQPANHARLVAILDLHIARGRFDSVTLGQRLEDCNGSITLATLAGTNLTARPNGAVNLLLRDPAGSFANISIYDVISANGVIHVIDKVLMPTQNP